MVDYKASLVYAGAFAVGAALAIAVLFILTDDASRAGVAALSCVAFISGVQVGRWLVRHFELAERNEELEAAGSRIADLEEALADRKKALVGKQAALDNERRKSAELAKRWSKEEERRAIEEQRNKDADRILKLSLPEHVIIDRILTAEANGKRYRAKYTEALGHLYSSGVIEDYGNGDVYMIKMNLRPFFEKYADAIHEIATGTNDDRIRIAEEVRQGTYVPRAKQ